MPEHPGGALAKRPIQFIYLVDCSGSMQGKKIESLNYAIRESISPMQKAADENPNAQALVRAIRFSDEAEWYIEQPVEIHSFTWKDLDAKGVTDMGHAFRLAAEALSLEKMPQRGLPPVLLLISDGQPTDDYRGGLKALMDQTWGKKAIRIAIAIGEDADLDVLQEFIANPEIKPLYAGNVQDLVKKIRWVSTAVLQAASSPVSRVTAGGDSVNIVIPAPPADTPAVSANDVF